MKKTIEKTKKCKYCQTDIPAKATVCPNCRRSLPRTSKGLMIFALLVVILGFYVLAVNGGMKDLQNEVSRDIEDSNSEYITMDEYNKIETGMTYEKVKSIVGSPGEVSSQVESDLHKIVIITWYGDGMTGANANVTFTNNKVTGKAQVGLK